MTFRPNDFGEMKIVDNANATSISSVDTWVKVTNFNAGQTNGVTFGNNELTATQAGDYLLISSGAATPASTNTVFEFGVFKSDTLISKSKVPIRFGPNETQPWSISGVIIDVGVQDTVSLRVRNLDDDTNVTVTDAAFTIIQI